jgi:hypothetical protein
MGVRRLNGTQNYGISQTQVKKQSPHIEGLLIFMFYAPCSGRKGIEGGEITGFGNYKANCNPFFF